MYAFTNCEYQRKIVSQILVLESMYVPYYIERAFTHVLLKFPSYAETDEHIICIHMYVHEY